MIDGKMRALWTPFYGIGGLHRRCKWPTMIRAVRGICRRQVANHSDRCNRRHLDYRVGTHRHGAQCKNGNQGDTMKKIFVFTMMVILFPVFSAWGATDVPSASIRDIVLYRNGAAITKEAGVFVDKGTTLITISGLTADLADESLQAGVKEKNGVRILEVKINRSFLQGVPQERLDAIRKQMEEIEGKIKDNSGAIAAIHSSIDFLKRTDPFAKNQKAPPTEIEAYAKFLEDALTADFRKIARLENANQTLTAEKTALEKELKKSGDERKESKTVAIRIHSDDARKGTLLITYMVKNAGWSPVYDVRADSDTGKIALASFAVITQSTGEEWKDAAIEISTARPSHGPAPEISPWYLNIYEPPLYKKAARSAQAEMMVMAPNSGGEESDSAAAPRMITEATSFSFLLPGRVTIPSDRQPHRVPMAAFFAAAKLDYYAVPKLSKYAYLQAGFKNPLPFPISSGLMHVFLDGKFVNATPVVRQILPDEEMHLSLGIDEGIKAERKLLKKFTEYSGVLSRDTHAHYDFETTITNGKNRPMTITVKDHLPVSRNEKIRVLPESPQKGDAEIADDGIITWQKDLKPGEKSVLKTTFTVTYPKGTLIRGLE